MKNQYRKSSRFLVQYSVLLTLTPIIGMMILGTLVFLLAKFNYIFFKASGVINVADLTESFNIFVFSSFAEYLIYFLVFMVLSLFINYIVIMQTIRPFIVISNKLDEISSGDKTVPVPIKISPLSPFRNLYSIFNSMITGKAIEGKRIFRRDPSPVLVLYLLLVLCIICIGYTVLAGSFNFIIYDNLTKLSYTLIPSKFINAASIFLGNQKSIIEEMLYVVFTAFLFSSVVVGYLAMKKVETLALLVKNIFFNISNGNVSYRFHMRADDAFPEIMLAINRYLDFIKKEDRTSGTATTVSDRVPSGP